MKTTTLLNYLVLLLILLSCNNEIEISTLSKGRISLAKEDDFQIEKVVLFDSIRVRKPVGISSKVFEFKSGEEVSHYLDLQYSSKVNARLDAEATSVSLPLYIMS